MTFGSLFAGIGGMDLGLERAGMSCRWQVEINPYCQQVLRKHWPDIPKHEDVNDVGAHNLEPVDVIAGGFPCQDLSVAGKRAGLDGDRSGLWWQFLRLALELRPRYLLVENVPGLLVRGQSDIFFGSLAEAGFDAEWECIRASDVGAPHIRERIFIIAYPNGEGPQGRIEELVRERSRERASRSVGASLPHPDGDPLRPEPEPIGWRQGAAQSSVDGEPQSVGDPEREGQLQPEGLIGEEWRRPCDASWWSVEPDVGRVAHGVSARVDRLRGLGNAVVPQVAEWIGRRLMEATR